MTTVDLVVLGVMFLSGIIAFTRGFVREVLSVVAWVGAVVAAIAFVPAANPLIAPHMPAPEWTDPVSFIVLFLISLIVLSLIAKTVAHAVRSSAIGGIDRTLGLIFGFARGAALAIAAYIIVGSWVTPVDQWPAQVLDARSLPLICSGAEWVARQIKEEYRPKVQPCLTPPTRQTAGDDILKTSPAGRAIDPPIRR